MTHRFFAALLLMIAGTLRAFDAQSEFTAGNSAYEQGKFAEAAAHYRQLISNHVATANVWFNLGNAEFKVEALGRAIAAYRRAEQLTPRDSALRANLAFVRRKATGDKESSVSALTQFLRFARPNEWATAASVSSAFLFLVLALSEMKGPRPRGLLSLLILTTLLLGAVAAASYRDRFVQRQAVVIATESAVRFGPLEESQTAFSLHQGAEVAVLDQSSGRGEWLQIRDLAGRSGWLKLGDVAVITP